jgi:hypothetical protein
VAVYVDGASIPARVPNGRVAHDSRRFAAAQEQQPEPEDGAQQSGSEPLPEPGDGAEREATS